MPPIFQPIPDPASKSVSAETDNVSLVFYDIESTGTTTAWDQMLQFGAIRSDGGLIERDRLNVRCRLQPHVVPAPGALRVTGLGPADLTNPALPSHYEAVHDLHSALVAWAPCLFLGWNSFRFDEALVRQSLYQTLHPPFLTTAMGNRRGDVLRMAQAASLFAPHALTIPLDDCRRPTFRLDRLAPLNGCGAGNAHEAIADAEATLAIARRLQQRAPALWRHLIDLTRRERVLALLRATPKLAHTEFVFGRPYSRMVTLCGENPDHAAEVAVFDLAFPPEKYIDGSVEDLVAVMRRSPKPILPVRAGSQPILMPADSAPADAAAWRIPTEELDRRVALIRNDERFRARVGDALAARYPEDVGDGHVEERLYQRRIPDADITRMVAFHDLPWPKRAALMDSFQDDRLRKIGRRLLWLERPDLLSSAACAELDRWAADRVLAEDPDVPWRTLTNALRELEGLLASAHDGANDDGSGGDPALLTLLTSVRDFLDALGERWVASMTAVPL